MSNQQHDGIQDPSDFLADIKTEAQIKLDECEGQNHFERLGLNPFQNDTVENDRVVKKAYIRLAQQYHSDKTKNLIRKRMENKFPEFVPSKEQAKKIDEIIKIYEEIAKLVLSSKDVIDSLEKRNNYTPTSSYNPPMNFGDVQAYYAHKKTPTIYERLASDLNQIIGEEVIHGKKLIFSAENLDINAVLVPDEYLNIFLESFPFKFEMKPYINSFDFSRKITCYKLQFYFPDHQPTKYNYTNELNNFRINFNKQKEMKGENILSSVPKCDDNPRKKEFLQSQKMLLNYNLRRTIEGLERMLTQHDYLDADCIFDIIDIAIDLIEANNSINLRNLQTLKTLSIHLDELTVAIEKKDVSKLSEIAKKASGAPSTKYKALGGAIAMLGLMLFILGSLSLFVSIGLVSTGVLSPLGLLGGAGSVGTMAGGLALTGFGVGFFSYGYQQKGMCKAINQLKLGHAP